MRRRPAERGGAGNGPAENLSSGGLKARRSNADASISSSMGRGLTAIICG
jgi:hypothetical protein